MTQFMKEPVPEPPNEGVGTPTKLFNSPAHSPYTAIRDLRFVKRRYTVLIGEVNDMKEEAKRVYTAAHEKRTSAKELVARTERQNAATERYCSLVEEEARREARQLLTESRKASDDVYCELISHAQQEIEKGKQELKQLVAARQILEEVRQRSASAAGRFVATSQNSDPEYGEQNGETN